MVIIFKALRESMKDVGLHQLIQLSLPTKFDFNPKKSKVTTSLSVTDGYRWRARKKQDLSQVRQDNIPVDVY